jgi:hypothetical protein
MLPVLANRLSRDRNFNIRLNAPFVIAVSEPCTVHGIVRVSNSESASHRLSVFLTRLDAGVGAVRPGMAYTERLVGFDSSLDVASCGIRP